ncbi:uridine kinase family protein [Streptomyces meridianus]|uniref:Uridine kinase n=1 Tax=Streptomyces meridianus TaxID=2938945 RepID=A0ABT0XCM0_9ACTN|nr:hypothetical protein [Streptomyces meridianus]MCM2580267.1 hypothetical protein [Streptomyces meridianus]
MSLAHRLRSLRPSCGPVRLVAVDGHAGSGKSTLAARLSEALGCAPVVHLDDLATHDELFAWTGRLREQVLEPLAAGRPARHRVYDWVRREFTGERVIRPEPVVLVEGVGAARRSVRPWLACSLWMDLAESEAWERGMRRDGPELAAFWAEWTRAERRHFAADPSRPHSGLLVTRHPDGYVVRTAGPEPDAVTNPLGHTP